jgi:type I restriction enzyme S subunit
VFCLMGTVILLKPNQLKVGSRYLHAAISAPATQAALKGASGATAVSALYLRDIAKLMVKLPTLAEQTEIVRRVDLLFGFADRLEARLQAAQTASSRLTPSLLAKAFRGELVPQDPNDEPASELLKRLAQSQPVAAKKGRGAARSPKAQA